jgi:FKBP-type peptidyl-prolyl cis-trans isomerase
MAMIVHSPHDGQAVKVRDQDLERAIRDREGRIFYAVKRSDGQGYYGALTRKGSAKDEQRYLDMLEKMQRARDVGAQRSAQQIHDATGKPSGPGALRWVLLLIVVALIAAVSWYVVQPDNPRGGTGQPPAGPDVPVTPSQGTGQADLDVAASSDAGAQGLPVDGDERVDDGAAIEDTAEGYIDTASGLRYAILRAGTGETAIAGRYVQVQFTASTLSGRPIDRSDPDHPVGFVLWSGGVLRGWDEGVAGMRVGEKRRLILPRQLLYGRYPGTAALPDAPLRFDIELVGILPGVRYTTNVPGHGPIARPGDTVKVHYTAYIDREQTPYDSTHNRGAPIEFRIGAGEVIQGWELGVVGMSEGETRTIEIPPYLGYGERGAAGVIPPGATLRYTVELLHVTGPASRHADIGTHHAG